VYHVIFSIDYEIHGNGDGDPMELMVEPTNRLLELFEDYGAKLTIMADVAEIMKFKEYFEKYGRDKYHYHAIVEQLQGAVRNGHDVQLHIHSGYFNSEFSDHGIKQNWDEYDLTNQPYDVISNRIKTCKSFLEEVLKKADSEYICTAFRAANWSMEPSLSISNALIANGIKIDSSVFKWGARSGRVKFNYHDAYDKLIPWFVSNENICRPDENGQLLEVPIYTELRSFWSFITFIRGYRMIRAKFHKHDSPPVPKAQMKVLSNREMKDSASRNVMKKSIFWKVFRPLIKKHAWKLDFNQATGSQLIKAVKRIEEEYNNHSLNLPIVLIGHSKSFIPYNKKTLRPFLEYIHQNDSVFNFKTFSDINTEDYR
jgi:hypothetical protein